MQLQPADPAIRQTLIRCLLGQDSKRNQPEAVKELHALVEEYAALDRLEDARSTCLKIIDLDKTNEQARRQLAKIFSTAAKDEQSEDVVVCVQCSEVNHREAQECQKCNASLQLTCLSCGRPVGVSDRLCIFCGADPHRGSATRRAGGTPATTRLVNPDKVKATASVTSKEGMLDRLDSLVAMARLKEQTEDWEAALTIWREVASIQSDNPDLLAHIRQVETVVHDRFVETQIENGHQFRRVRRYWAAIRSYRAALRTMPSDDPRTSRLVEILAATQRVGNRIALVYAASFLVIALGAAAAIYPIMKERGLHKEIEALQEQIVDAEKDPKGTQLAALKTVVPGGIDDLSSRIESLGDGDRWRRIRRSMADVTGTWQVAFQHTASRDIERVHGMIETGDLKRADTDLSAHIAVFKDDSTPRIKDLLSRLSAQKKNRDNKLKQIQDAPRLLAAAQATEASGSLGAAMSQFRDVAESPNEEVATKARAAIARLAPQADAVNASIERALRNVERLRTSDLLRADAELAAVEQTAVAWSAGDSVRQARAAIATELSSAKADVAALGNDASIERLAAFIARHPGAPDTAAIRQRHEVQVRAETAKKDKYARYRGFLDNRQWEQAWSAGRDLVAGYGTQLPADFVLPLVVESMPAGATVRLNGKIIGQTPSAVVQYTPGQQGDLVIEAAGWQPVTKSIRDAAQQWRLAAELHRAGQWHVDVGHQIGSIQVNSSDEIILAGTDCVITLANTGQKRSQGALAVDDALGGGRSRLHDLPGLFPDGRIAVALPGTGVRLFDNRGAAVAYATKAEVRGRPISYVNDVMGATPRIAFAAEAIYSGTPGAQLTTKIPLSAAATSGPVAITKGIDRMLVIADTRGRLVAVEESTKKQLWELHVQAADIGQLLLVSETDAVAILDGSRLVCFTLGEREGSLRWSHQLVAPAVGDPIVSGNVIYIACGKQVSRVGIDGSVQAALPLPVDAAAPPAAMGDRVVIGCVDSHLLVFKDGNLLWSTPLDAVPTAVGLSKSGVYAITGNGSLTAFQP